MIRNPQSKFPSPEQSERDAVRLMSAKKSAHEQSKRANLAHAQMEKHAKPAHAVGVRENRSDEYAVQKPESGAASEFRLRKSVHA